MIVVTRWFGVFLCDKEKVRKSILFEKEPKSIAAKLARIQHGEIIPEEEEISKGLKRLRVADARLSKIGKPEVFDASFIKAEDFGYTQDLMQTVMVELGKLRTREPLSPDKGIVQAIRAIDDLTEQINVLSERLHEWYGLHFPELGDYAKDEKYSELIANHGGREDVLKALELHLESVGAELMDEDVTVIQEFATAVFSLYETKERLESYVQRRMEEYAPNLTALLSANLGARLISLAGGLGRLTRLPSSTLQLLGAEKAMFLHLRSGKAPPKHGIIFQYPAIHRAPYWQRGKVARTLAGKALIAAKVDFYQGGFIGEKLKAEMDARIEEIRRKYPEAPKKQPQRPQARRSAFKAQYKKGKP